ncbi:MAG: YihA family ribosome biogenesis GTP-binding protein [Burkholderiaceae bacterium]|nr:YihA family ribosome biogenesis GTP-binding protein [Burkholderiaceae bacterium]
MSAIPQNPLPPLKDWIHQISFLTSAARAADLPSLGAGEVAIAGRSNAGKSSALNLICNRRRLAFSSKTPGRTQLINLFTLQHQDTEIGRLVDLPGYGYAAVDRTTKARWQRELANFLESRISLVGLIVVMDIRHPFGPLDLQLLQWFDRRQQPIHVLLTKADKLTRNEQARALAAAKRSIAEHANSWGERTSVSLFSATTRIGRDEVLEKIAQWWQVPASQETMEKPKKKPGEGIAGRERLN